MTSVVAIYGLLKFHAHEMGEVNIKQALRLSVFSILKCLAYEKLLT